MRYLVAILAVVLLVGGLRGQDTVAISASTAESYLQIQKLLVAYLIGANQAPAQDYRVLSAT